MKKYIALALALIMALSCLTACGSGTNDDPGDGSDAVLKAGDVSVTWDQFMYWLNGAANELEGYYTSYSSTGTFDWDDPCMFDSSISNAEWCVKRATQTVTELCAIETYANEKGITPSEEDVEKLEGFIDEYVTYYCGEDGTEEDFEREILNPDFLTLDYYRQIFRTNLLYQGLFEDAYGANGEKLSDEDALTFADENKYVTATHILLMTIDDEGKSLDDAAIAEKRAKLQSVADELKAITDHEQLVAKFKEYKEELCEDTGKTYYPDGYCFTVGVMDSSFDTAARELEEYALSELVQSVYGLHLIMRLPNDPDAIVSDASSSGSTLRSLAAADAFNDLVNDRIKATDCSFVGQYKDYDFTTLFGDEGFAGWLQSVPQESAAPVESAAPEESPAA